MFRKWTNEKLDNFIAENLHGWKRVGDVKGYTQPVELQCNNGHFINMRIFHLVKDGHRCSKCFVESQKPNIEEVYSKFIKEGYIPKSEYVTAKSKITLTCPNGSDWTTTPNRFFSDNQRCTCSKCRIERRKKPVKRSEKDLEILGFKVLGNWVNVDTKIEVECKSCGYRVEIIPYRYIAGKTKGCPNCNKRVRLSTSKFRKIVEKDGYHLLSEVSGVLNKCVLQCDKNHEPYEVVPNSYLNEGCRCPYCAYELKCGENNWRWNPDLTDEERILRRIIPEYNEWKQSVKKKDNYICQCCGQIGGNLESHHLNGFNLFPEQRYDVDNGATLCTTCHKDFHDKYGRGNNTRQQYEEWIANKQIDNENSTAI